MSESISVLPCGVLCIGGFLVMVMGMVALLLINRSNSRKKEDIPVNWKSVTGRVTVAIVEETVRTRPDDDVFFYPAIKYEYKVEDQIYTGRKAVGKPFNLESIAKRALAQYPSGSEIALRYNPENPGESRLQEM